MMSADSAQSMWENRNERSETLYHSVLWEVHQHTHTLQAHSKQAKCVFAWKGEKYSCMFMNEMELDWVWEGGVKLDKVVTHTNPQSPSYFQHAAFSPMNKVRVINIYLFNIHWSHPLDWRGDSPIKQRSLYLTKRVRHGFFLATQKLTDQWECEGWAVGYAAFFLI